MNIPPEYEDVVAKLDAALSREAALREELAALRESYEAMRDRKNSIVDLQQRLTVAERRESEAREELLDLSRKLDVFYSRSHGIKNLSAIEDANDKSKALQQRLTVAEQRAGVMEKALMRIARPHDCGCLPCTGDCTSKLSLEITVDCMRDTAEAALKPAAKPHKCIECDSQYCHGVCVERGDDDERYKGAEGEGS